MKNLFLALVTLVFMSTNAQEVYKVGDKASDFILKNIDGKMISLSQYKSAKGFVVIFTCNHCPYVITSYSIHYTKLYEYVKDFD